MPWVSLLAYAVVPGASVSPVDSATTDFVTYVVSFGLAGIGLLLLFWLYVWPGKLTQKARDEGRADLLKELERALARAERAEQQRDEAMSIAQEKLVPLVSTFTQTISALLPLMQPRTGYREGSPQ